MKHNDKKMPADIKHLVGQTGFFAPKETELPEQSGEP